MKATMTSNVVTTGEAIGDVYCSNKICNGKTNLLPDARKDTPRSIYGCKKCGAWPVVHSAFFTLQEHVRKKTARPRFFCSKKMNMLHGKQMLKKFQFNQPYMARKYCSICTWTKIFKRFLELCIVQHVPTKSVFTFQPKIFSFCNCK